MSNCIKLIIISLAVFCSSILCGQNANANVSYGSCVQPGAFLFDDAVEVCIGYFDGGGSFVLMDCNSQQLGGINGFFHKSTTLSNFFLSNAVWLKVTYSNGCDVYLRDSSWIVFAPPLPPAPSPDYNFCLGPNTDYNSLEIVSDCDVFIEPGGFQGGNKLIVRPKLENDSDGDGTPDEEDAFPNDPSEWLDTDGDTIGNNTDSDDDNDTYSDVNDAFPLDASEWLDTDGDTIGNNADTDDDNDSYLDDSDAFPLDASEWIDTDGDLVGDNSDAFPNDPAETTDTDGDGVGDNADLYTNYNDSVILNFISEYNSTHNFFQLEEIQDLRPGSTMIQISENQATVQLQMEESSDLQIWEDTGTPATMTIPADTDTKFFRFKMAE
jgi:hypothetical protein